jgi:hypothetical protein
MLIQSFWCQLKKKRIFEEKIFLPSFEPKQFNFENFFKQIVISDLLETQ